ncbi:MAG: hypothetical protein HYZ09_04195 [Candidatus Kerfeldbacteria bacterium]|nr:hypothetical protein [Candidatus Kerfeldbacteria bacterium]
MESLNERQHTLLTSLIREYVLTATPVASQALVGKRGLDVSPATIRNELLELEQAGYLEQPYTSAGRIPSQAAWRLYVDELLTNLEDTAEPVHPAVEQLQTALDASRRDPDRLVRVFAKQLAEVFDEAVIVGLSRQDVYYTGLSHLFSQPEFSEVRSVVAISALVDRLDELVGDLYDTARDRIDVLLGRDNPLGDSCSLLVTQYVLPRHEPGMMAVLGPVRQDYANHLPLLRYATQLLKTV